MRLPSLYIDAAGNKGRGVFTRRALKAGVVIETSPVITMVREEHLLLKNTLLRNYIFEWDPPGKPKMGCLAMGWVELYNHAYHANAEHTMDYTNNTISVKTVKDIRAGEEITINYNGRSDSPYLVWFHWE